MKNSYEKMLNQLVKLLMTYRLALEIFNFNLDS